MIVNNGTQGAQIAFGNSSVVAVNTASAAGTNQVYVAAGSTLTVGTNGNQYFSAITDTSTTSLILHLGAGS